METFLFMLFYQSVYIFWILEENESGDSRTSQNALSSDDLPTDTTSVLTDGSEDATTDSTHTSDVPSVVTQSVTTNSQTASPGDSTDAFTSVPGVKTTHGSSKDPTDAIDVPTGFPEDPTMYPSSNNDYNYDPNYFYDYDYFGYDYFYLGGPEETKEEEYRVEETIRAEIAMKNDSEAYHMGHQFEDLVFECSFRGYDCRYVVFLKRAASVMQYKAMFFKLIKKEPNKTSTQKSNKTKKFFWL